MASVTGIEAEWITFDSRIRATYIQPKIALARGASNGPQVLENGLRLGLFNLDVSLDRIDELVDAGRALVLITSVMLPPGRALNLALVFKGEALERVGDRLDAIRHETIEGGRKAGQPKGKANKVRVYLHASGVYLRQDTDPARIEPDEGMGPALWASDAWYADINSEPDLSAVAHAWLGYFGGLLEVMPRSIGARLLQAPAEPIVHLLVDPSEVKTCPRCELAGQVSEFFGTRKMRRTLPDGTELFEERAQSFCNPCRKTPAADPAPAAVEDASIPVPERKAPEVAPAPVESVEILVEEPAVAAAQTIPPDPLPHLPPVEQELEAADITLIEVVQDDEPLEEPVAGAASASSLDEPVPVARSMGPLLNRLGIQTWRDALTLDLACLEGQPGIGRKKLKRLGELQAEARVREANADGTFSANAPRLDEPVPISRSMGPLLERLGIQTWRDAMAVDLVALEGLPGIGRTKLKRLHELQVEARERALVAGDASPAQPTLFEWIEQSPWADWEPQLALGRLGARVLSVIERFELTTVAHLARWHTDVVVIDVPNYGRGAHRKLEKRLEALKAHGQAHLVFQGPVPTSIQELAERYLAVLSTDRKQKVFALRYIDGLTLEGVGEHFDLTRERVRQILKTEIARDLPAWSPCVQELVEPAIERVERGGGIAATTDVMGLLAGPKPWALRLALDLSAMQDALLIDVLPGVTTTLSGDDFRALRKGLRADVEAGLEAGFARSVVEDAFAWYELRVPDDELPRIAKAMLNVVIEGDRAWPDRRSTLAAYVGALHAAGGPTSAADIAAMIDEREPEIEPSPHSVVVALRRADQVFNVGSGLWVHEEYLPVQRVVLDALARRCLPVLEDADGAAINAVHLLADLREQGDVPPEMTPHLLREALMKTKLVRGWRVGTDVAWKAGDIQRTSIEDWIHQIANDMEQPFLLHDLLTEVAEVSGCKYGSVHAAQGRMSADLLSVGNSEYLARRAVFGDDEWRAAIAEVEALVSARTIHSAFAPLPGLGKALSAKVRTYGRRLIWGLAHQAPGLNTRRRGLLMWAQDCGERDWDVYGPALLRAHPICRSDDLYTHLQAIAGLDDKALAGQLLYDGVDAGYLVRLGMGWFIDARLSEAEQMRLMLRHPALVRFARGDSEFMRGLAPGALLSRLRERLGVGPS